MFSYSNAGDPTVFPKNSYFWSPDIYIIIGEIAPNAGCRGSEAEADTANRWSEDLVLAQDWQLERVPWEI